MTSRARLAVPLIAAVVALAGCTADDPTSAGATEGSQAAADGGSEAVVTDPGTASVADQVMGEQTIATPHGGGDSWGGEVTVTLRSVEVGGENMTVRWALRWDDDEAPADAGASYYDMGVVPSTTVTDRDALKAYKPYCTEGAWQADTTSATDASLERLRCSESMLVSPLENIGFKFPNHGTIEAWAVLPAPEGEPATLDVAPAEGLPLFTDATVTYLDGSQE
ncbi:hypothetical protein MWU57_13705 [Isoptericola sp. S6320L]|uniref:hypothetical protein n=1 Tax=Isoptericola sp. S6320L TaxID=2926411 RepID=UPI001FF3C1F9|nr:hypothetical protein [Isoptericola sp. S6320L]MCK0118089.1 hypothetical protein [Isoptericola sp. S6320L]